MPRNTTLRAMNARMQHVRTDEQAVAEVVPVAVGHGVELEPSWIARPTDQQPGPVQLGVEQPLVRAVRDERDQQRERQRRSPARAWPDHGTADSRTLADITTIRRDDRRSSVRGRRRRRPGHDQPARAAQRDVVRRDGRAPGCDGARPAPTTPCESSCSPARATRRSARAPISAASPRTRGAAAAHEGRGLLADLFRDMWSLGKPIVARVRGYALAGGFGLACACDLIVAADDAVFGTPEINVGLWPYMITVPLLRSMPPKTALDLMMTGRRVVGRGGQSHRFRATRGARRRARRDGRRARRRPRGEVAAHHAVGSRLVLPRARDGRRRRRSRISRGCSPSRRTPRTRPRASRRSPRSARRSGRVAE